MRESMYAMRVAQECCERDRMQAKVTENDG